MRPPVESSQPALSYPSSSQCVTHSFFFDFRSKEGSQCLSKGSSETTHDAVCREGCSARGERRFDFACVGRPW